MTTPNVDLTMIMPQTTLFTGATAGNQNLKASGLDFVYLPKGTSMVQIVATGMKGTRLHVNLVKAGGASTNIADVQVESETQRVLTDTFANANSTHQGMWLKVFCFNLTAGQVATGTVGVTITPMQVE